MARLAGRVAIVTGGARGIGRHYSQALAAEGARVMIADVADGSDLANELSNTYGANSVASQVTDISNEQAVKALVGATIERFGKVDVLVNNAALYSSLKEQKFQDIDVEVWDQVMSVNLRGTFLMCKHVVPHMIAQNYGKIINIGSGTPTRGVPWLLHYTTTKGGVIGMTRAMSRELGGHGIRVNTLSPGFTMSDSNINNNPGHVQTARSRCVRSNAMRRRRIWSGRWCSSPRARATSSPARISRWMAARRICDQRRLNSQHDVRTQTLAEAFSPSSERVDLRRR